MHSYVVRTIITPCTSRYKSKEEARMTYLYSVSTLLCACVFAHPFRSQLAMMCVRHKQSKSRHACAKQYSPSFNGQSLLR